MSAIVSEIIEIMTAGLTGIASGIGAGLTAIVTNVFLTGAGTNESPYALSVFGGVVIVFAGVSLAIGLSRWVVNFITSLGQRNR